MEIQNVTLVCYVVHLEVFVRNFNNRDSMDANSDVRTDCEMSYCALLLFTKQSSGETPLMLYNFNVTKIKI